MSALTAFVLGMLTTIILTVAVIVAQDWFARRAAEAVRNAHAKALATSFRLRPSGFVGQVRGRRQ